VLAVVIREVCGGFFIPSRPFFVRLLVLCFQARFVVPFLPRLAIVDGERESVATSGSDEGGESRLLVIFLWWLLVLWWFSCGPMAVLVGVVWVGQCGGGKSRLGLLSSDLSVVAG